MSTGLAAEPSGGAPLPRRPRPQRRRRAPAWAAPAALFVLAAARLRRAERCARRCPSCSPTSCATRTWRARWPTATGFTWRGDHVGQSAALYVYVLAPLWALWSSTVDAWHASKVLGTLLLCAQVFPVYRLGRELLGPAGALAAAALSVAGTWMLLQRRPGDRGAGHAADDRRAVRRGRSRCAARAAGCGSSRWPSRCWRPGRGSRLAVLLPALAAAFALDVARAPAARRAARGCARTARRWPCSAA